MLEAYLATPDEAVKALNRHVMQPGSSPTVPGSNARAVDQIDDMPGLLRLTCIGKLPGPEYSYYAYYIADNACMHGNCARHDSGMQRTHTCDGAGHTGILHGPSTT